MVIKYVAHPYSWESHDAFLAFGDYALGKRKQSVRGAWSGAHHWPVCSLPRPLSDRMGVERAHGGVLITFTQDATQSPPW